MNIVRDNQGLTLIETLIGIAIFVTAVGVVYMFVSQGFKVQNFSLQGSQAIAEARRGLDTMVKEIRETQIADNGAYPIERADKFEFIFYADIDKDDSVERIRYFLDGTDFKKGVIQPRINPVGYFSSDEVISIISRYVRNTASEPLFTYYNSNWPADTVNNPLPYPAKETDVRFIKINLKVNVQPEMAPDNFEILTYVHIRNLKDNL